MAIQVKNNYFNQNVKEAINAGKIYDWDSAQWITFKSEKISERIEQMEWGQLVDANERIVQRQTFRIDTFKCKPNNGEEFLLETEDAIGSTYQVLL